MLVGVGKNVKAVLVYSLSQFLMRVCPNEVRSNLRLCVVEISSASFAKDHLGKADLFAGRPASHHLFSPHRPADLPMQPGLFPHGKYRYRIQSI